MPKDASIKKVLLIGSGPIVIGQAAEFDYAGAQACRVLKDEGIDVVLVNSNPATIMTDKALADEIYLEPLTAETVKRIIEKERPDSLLAGLGGQTGLTIAMQLSHEGFLERHGVRLLGTKAEAIDRAEDRQLFSETMEKLNQPIIPSDVASDIERAKEIAAEIGYPVIIRPAFTLGGAGGGVANNEEELCRIAHGGIAMSPINQVLVEKYIFGWKEIEFEVMRDGAGNSIAICSMENVDPVGVHTGDSIVVAPAVTLSDVEYGMLKRAALDIITELKIEGGCNVQFALDPMSMDYAVIEVNPRVSRSSALASKATGYPIAKVTTKIALGYTLDEIRNDVTGKTFACFEPAIDYLVVKFPKWPFDKFAHESRTLGTQMKATGEVMSIAPTFEAAIMKAVRGAEISLDTLRMEDAGEPGRATDIRLFQVYGALANGATIEEIHEKTRIDRWFLAKIMNLVNMEKSLALGLDSEKYLAAKKMGYTDAAIERISGIKVADKRLPVYKMVDTCAGEFSAETPYFYATYDNVCESREVERTKPCVIVLGSGPIRIGQGIEFDYSSVHCVWTLKEMGYDVVIINNNPETVSTDFDTADRLYFEPLTPEDVMGVIEVEKPVGVVVAFGGQTAIKLTGFLDKAGIPILGTSAEGIDTAEDRERFDALLEKYGIRRPKGMGVLTLEEAVEAAEKLGYPVLLRPSYVIGGQNMVIAHSEEDVRSYMGVILSGGIDNPVLVDKYMPGIEIEVDVISDGKDVLIPGIMEHIERAGVHSGDSIAVYPPFNLPDTMREQVIRSSTELALSLGTKGLVNIQYLIYQNELYVIEVNPRASRTIPYISKVTGVAMVDAATRVMMGENLIDMGYGAGLYPAPPYFAVKVPVFSFEKLQDAHSALGPEMKSTGEVLGLGKTLEEALFKGMLSAGFKMEEKGGVLISVCDTDQPEVAALAKKYADLGFEIYATPDTAREIAAMDIETTVVKMPGKNDDILDLLNGEKLVYVIYTGAWDDNSIHDYIRVHRRAIQLGVPCLTSLDTANALADTLMSRYREMNTELVDINCMRTYREKHAFTKMHGSGDDYIFFENLHGEITCPESLAITLSRRHYGIGGDGLVLIEPSRVADAKMRIFNSDGSEGRMAGNAIRCVGKYLYDNGIVRKLRMKIETASGIKDLSLILADGRVSSVCVNVGKADFAAANLPADTEKERLMDESITVNGEEYRMTCVSIGNPHCVVEIPRIEAMDVAAIGHMFENHPMFPERINTEFVTVVNRRMIKMRVWERGNGETLCCGTGACAAVAALSENGLVDKNKDITVKVRGGDLIVRCTDDAVYLTGEAKLVYTGQVEF